jgi:hypothetical protein
MDKKMTTQTYVNYKSVYHAGPWPKRPSKGNFHGYLMHREILEKTTQESKGNSETMQSHESGWKSLPNSPLFSDPGGGIRIISIAKCEF